MSTHDSKHMSKEHETHTGALVFLILAALVVCFVAFSATRMNTTPHDRQAAVAEKSGQIENIGQLPENATTKEGMSDFPEGLPVSGADIIENYEMPIPGEMERVVTYRSASSAAEIHDKYISWLQDNDYEILKHKNATIAASVAALNQADEDLIVLIYGGGDGTHVQLITHY